VCHDSAFHTRALIKKEEYQRNSHQEALHLVLLGAQSGDLVLVSLEKLSGEFGVRRLHLSQHVHLGHLHLLVLHHRQGHLSCKKIKYQLV